MLLDFHMFEQSNTGDDKNERVFHAFSHVDRRRVFLQLQHRVSYFLVFISWLICIKDAARHGRIQFHSTPFHARIGGIAENGVEWRALVWYGLAELDLDWNYHFQSELA